jgi:hypothetical protein
VAGSWCVAVEAAAELQDFEGRAVVVVKKRAVLGTRRPPPARRLTGSTGLDGVFA